MDSDKYKKFLKSDVPENTIIEEWDDLRKVMWSGNGVVAPRKFVHNIQKVADIKNRDIFTGFAQNDMPEFLQFFMECLHNSISRSVNIHINGNSENEIDNLAIKCYQMLKNIYSKEYSEILDMFYGISFSELVSTKRNKRLSVVPESFFIIDLPVTNNNHQIAKNIYDCFDLFTEPEYLEGDNAWYNEKTKLKEDVKKQYHFWNFPSIIVIALKRFTPDGSKKMTHLIDFPLEDLDLSTYTKGYNSKSYKYNLYGVCNHIGSVSGGHYTAFVKNSQNKWIHYNDHIVEKVENSNVIISPLAYCLFYRKKNN